MRSWITGGPGGWWTKPTAFWGHDTGGRWKPLLFFSGQRVQQWVTNWGLHCHSFEYPAYWRETKYITASEIQGASERCWSCRVLLKHFAEKSHPLHWWGHDITPGQLYSFLRLSADCMHRTLMNHVMCNFGADWRLLSWKNILSLESMAGNLGINSRNSGFDICYFGDRILSRVLSRVTV